MQSLIPNPGGSVISVVELRLSAILLYKNIWNVLAVYTLWENLFRSVRHCVRSGMTL